MTKRELIAEVTQQYPHLAPQAVEAVVQTVFASLTQALVAGERIELRDFGNFDVKQHRSRAARNPRTGVLLAVPAKKVAFFRVAQALRRRLEGTGTLAEASGAAEPEGLAPGPQRREPEHGEPAPQGAEDFPAARGTD